MNPLFDYWMKLSLRIILLFATAMLVSFSPEYLRLFFGDVSIQPTEFGSYFGGGMIDQHWNWGFRHYLYFYMCISLFFVQVIRIFTWIQTNNNKFTA